MLVEFCGMWKVTSYLQPILLFVSVLYSLLHASRAVRYVERSTESFLFSHLVELAKSFHQNSRDTYVL
jgi:hypothetical protein